MAKESEYTKDKLIGQKGFYVPKAKEYQHRAKDITDPEKRKAVQREKGLINENPGIKTEQGKIFKKQLEDLTGQKQDQIGTYTEAPGGGTPLARGTKAPSDEWVKEHRQMQPRDPETGKFEYNNANAKGTKYPSRGEKTPMFIAGVGFDKIFDKISKTEHNIITDEGKTATARFDMTKGEFIEALKNASEHLGFTTRWSVEEKKGRHTNEEKQALDNGVRGKVSGENLFDYKKDLSKQQERAIAANDSDESKFKGNLESMQLTKQYQAENKNAERKRTKERTERDKRLDKKWSAGQIDDEMIKAVLDVKPTTSEKALENPKKYVETVMHMKNKKGEKRFKNFEDFRHWSMGNRNRGWFD